jgi:Tol biopolymer transport system component
LVDGIRANRLTFASENEAWHIWSADGRHLTYRLDDSTASRLYMKPASGAGEEELLLALPRDAVPIPNDWSPDGRFMMYHRRDPETGRDLWVLPREGERTPRVLLKAPFDQAAGDISPDGRWVAYQSNESGRYEIYVRPFLPFASTPAGQWQVSTSGGMFAKWRPDGREVFYNSPNGEMMAVSVSVAAGTPEFGSPTMLFRPRIYGNGADNVLGRQYDVSADGRFLINTVPDEVASPITLIQHWTPQAD